MIPYLITGIGALGLIAWGWRAAYNPLPRWILEASALSFATGLFAALVGALFG